MNRKVRSPSAHPMSSTDPTRPSDEVEGVGGVFLKGLAARGAPSMTPLAWVSCELGLLSKLEGDGAAGISGSATSKPA